MENAITSRRARIYIVDDSADIRERIALLLRDHTKVDIVGEAESPFEASRGIFDTRPDLVVLDMQLIGGTGLDVLRLVHPIAPEIVFAVITNHPSQQYQYASLKAGATYFLDKSTGMEELANVVAALNASLQ